MKRVARRPVNRNRINANSVSLSTLLAETTINSSRRTLAGTWNDHLAYGEYDGRSYRADLGLIFQNGLRQSDNVPSPGYKCPPDDFVRTGPDDLVANGVENSYQINGWTQTDPANRSQAPGLIRFGFIQRTR